MLTLVVSVKVFQKNLCGSNVLVYCDNQATVEVVNSGKTRDEFMQACLRELCFITARAQCQVRCVHIEGVSNRLPDILSRWHLTHNPEREFMQLIGDRNMIELSLSESVFKFENRW